MGFTARLHSPVIARKLRVEYAGAIYHVMNRGDRRELIFMDDTDRQRFVDTLGEACAKTGWQIHVTGS
jgi:putative transposase